MSEQAEMSCQSRSKNIVPLKILRLMQWPERGELHMKVILTLGIVLMSAAAGVATLQFFYTLTIGNVTMILTITEGLLCAVYLVVRSRDYGRIFGEFQKTLASPDHLSHLSRQMVAECERKATVFLTVWILAGLGIHVFYLLGLLLDLVYASDLQVSNHTLMLTSMLGEWLHMDADPVAMHFILQFFTSSGFLICGLYYIFYDAVFVALSLHVCCQFDILKVSLRAIAQGNCFSAQPRAGSAGEDCVTTDSSVSVVSKHEKPETARFSKMLQCIKHHQKILSVFAELNELLSPMIFMMVVDNLFKMTIVTVDMVLTPVSDINFGGILQLQICTMIHVILYCWGSAEITWQSEMVLDAAYECGWTEASGHFKQLLIVLMIRTSRPASFTIGGYGPITLQTFLGMTNFAYSVYAVLRQTYN